MARRNRGRGSNEGSIPETDRNIGQGPAPASGPMRAQSTTAISTLATGTIPANHALNVMGVGNARRYFDLEDPTNGPGLVFRIVEPFKSLIRGYSRSNVSSQDSDAAIDTDASPSDPLYAITPAAMHSEQSVWPVLQNLFSSGTGSRYSGISFSEWVRYNSMLLEAYQFMLMPIQINYLTYHFDWTKVYPFSPDVPTWLYALASQMDATDVGIAEKYLPLIKRFDTKVAFPRIIEEFRRMSTPFYAVDLNARLQVPLPLNPIDTTTETIIGRVEPLLDYLDVQLKDASALFQTFLPFPMMLSDPWNVEPGNLIDVNRDSGWFNSMVRYRPPFGDTGDPTPSEALVFASEEGNQVPYYSRHTQPTWDEVRLATIYREDGGILDDTWVMMTFHNSSHISLFDDKNQVGLYDSSQILSADTRWRYLPYTNNRWSAGSGVKWGQLQQGYMGANITLDAVERLVRLDVDHIYNVDLLKSLMVDMTGSSLRELRDVIRRSVMAGIRSDT